MLVTGGASGIGAAVVRRLSKAGAHVAIIDRNEEAARQIADEVAGLALPGDVSDPDIMPMLTSVAEDRFGRLDVVFLNAGTTAGQSGIADLDVLKYRQLVGVNTDHVVFGVCAAVPALRRAGGGTIIATASLAGLIPMAGDTLYTLTKHAVVGYVRAAGEALAEEGIRVCAVCPGFVDTPLTADLRDQFGDFPMLVAEDVADAVDAILDRGEPGEVWYVQPGREPGPYGFRGVPGPKGGTRPPALKWND
ncbi:MAG TPA: SDR family NAD(P)-dependent oxidoreductase [Pseudonocardia sp.]|uniref:SDR family oxidoreductase n=1 Tax=Pseudonocardia sp. TaxID=60912 RepID=UPI002C451E27|nr:SDR family NAD(P)-dependent oxidoreductase [Pseudonocardia sp.]HTF49604.1 SDR family NAD(P)-dependent oxidoreductase [Pseudonocardia sp.]